MLILLFAQGGRAQTTYKFQSAGAKAAGSDSTAMQKQYESVFTAYEQELKSITLSDTTYRWGIDETVTYHVPSTSAFAAAGNHDTLFCVIGMQTFNGKRNLCIPTNRLSDTICTCHFVIPDSALDFGIKIYSIKEQVSGKKIGNSFACKTREGKSLPGFGAGSGPEDTYGLDAQVKLCPWYYATYAIWAENAKQGIIMGTSNKTMAAFNDKLRAVISNLEHHPSESAGKYLVLSKLYYTFLKWTAPPPDSSSLDSASFANLRAAAAMNTYDDAFDDDFFWQRFDLTPAKAHIITPLAVRFPRTKMAQQWLATETSDTTVDTIAFKHIANAWQNSSNTGILHTIGKAYDYPPSPMFNPHVSLFWLGKAEHTIDTRAGFYNGEDVYDCQPDKLPDLLRSKVYALTRAGYTDSAIGVAKSAIASAKYKKDLVGLHIALGFTYLQQKNADDAKRCCGIALALDAPKITDETNMFYDAYKLDNETKRGFASRMIDTYGKNVPDPLEFRYATLDGSHGTLRALQGKVVVLDFWFIGCEGCEMEKKSISDLADFYKDNKGIVFLSIALNDKDALTKYLSKVKYDLPVIPDPDGNIAQKFSVVWYPTHIIIGKDGKIMDTSTGGSEKIGDMLRPKIDQALAK